MQISLRIIEVGQSDRHFSCFLHKFRITFEPRHEKTGFCICENKDADQLRGNREAGQRLYFRYIASTFPLAAPVAEWVRSLYFSALNHSIISPRCLV